MTYSKGINIASNSPYFTRSSQVEAFPHVMQTFRLHNAHVLGLLQSTSDLGFIEIDREDRSQTCCPVYTLNEGPFSKCGCLQDRIVRVDDLLTQLDSLKDQAWSTTQSTAMSITAMIQGFWLRGFLTSISDEAICAGYESLASLSYKGCHTPFLERLAEADKFLVSLEEKQGLRSTDMYELPTFEPCSGFSSCVPPHAFSEAPTAITPSLAPSQHSYAQTRTSDVAMEEFDPFSEGDSDLLPGFNDSDILTAFEQQNRLPSPPLADLSISEDLPSHISVIKRSCALSMVDNDQSESMTSQIWDVVSGMESHSFPDPIGHYYDQSFKTRGQNESIEVTLKHDTGNDDSHQDDIKDEPCDESEEEEDQSDEDEESEDDNEGESDEDEDENKDENEDENEDEEEDEEMCEDEGDDD